MITRRILFVGGPDFDGDLRRRLEQKGLLVSAAGNLENAADLLTGSRIDLVIVDLDNNADGLDFIKRIRKMPVLAGTSVLAVGQWGTGRATLALSSGADAYEPAPLDSERLVDAIERILNKRAAAAGMNE